MAQIANFQFSMTANLYFFVDNINIARTYGDIIIKAELTINNPVEFDFNNLSTYYFNNKWYLPSDLASYMKTISQDIKKGYSLDDDIKEELEYNDYDMKFGDLDGIIMRDINDSYSMFSNHHPATNYVVFDSSQINIIK